MKQGGLSLHLPSGLRKRVNKLLTVLTARNAAPQTPLELLERGNVKALRKLLMESPELLNEPVDRDGNTLLIVSSARGEVRVVTWLARKHECCLDAQNRYGWTAVYEAVAHGEVGILRALLSAGADPTVRATCFPHQSPLQMARHLSRVIAVRMLENAERLLLLDRARGLCGLLRRRGPPLSCAKGYEAGGAPAIAPASARAGLPAHARREGSNGSWSSSWSSEPDGSPHERPATPPSTPPPDDNDLNSSSHSQRGNHRHGHGENSPTNSPVRLRKKPEPIASQLEDLHDALHEAAGAPALPATSPTGNSPPSVTPFPTLTSEGSAPAVLTEGGATLVGMSLGSLASDFDASPRASLPLPLPTPTFMRARAAKRAPLPAVEVCAGGEGADEALAATLEHVLFHMRDECYDVLRGLMGV